MKRVSFIILLLFTNIYANPKADSLLSLGLNFLYSFQLEKAEDTFSKITLCDKSSPIGYHYISTIYLWNFLGDKDESSYSKYFALSEKALVNTEKLLDQDDENLRNNYIMGSIYMMRAIAFAAKGNSLKAFWASKNSISYFETVIDKNPHYYDTYLGLGVFKYNLSFVPGAYSWVLSLSGISGDKKEGLKFIKMAFEKGKIAKYEAAFHLGKIYTEYISDYKKADYYLGIIVNKFPHNIMFQYQYAILKMRQKKMEEAEKILQKIIAIKLNRFKQLKAFSYFLLGDIHFKQNNFKQAVSYYKKFIETTTQIDYTGIANYRMAICYGMLDNKLEFQRYLILSEAGSKELKEDRIAAEKASDLFGNRLSPDFINVTLSSNLIESGKYKKAYKLLEEKIYQIKSRKLQSIAFLRFAQAAFQLKLFEETKKYLSKAEKHIEKKTEWIKCASFILKAKIAIQKNEIKKAEEFLEEAEDNIEGEYEQIFTGEINFLKQKLN